MNNNFLDQLNNIYQKHKKYHFSKKSEKHWLKLKFLLSKCKDENKKTDFFKNIKNKLLKTSKIYSVDKEKIKNFIFKRDAVFLYFVNGKLNKNISNINNIWYKISINKYNKQNYKNNSIKHNIYTHLAESLSKEILSISIDNTNNINIKPLYLIYLNEGNINLNEIIISNYRNYININSTHPIIIFEHFMNINQSYFNNVYNTFIIEKNSKLENYKFIYNKNNNNYHYANNNFFLYKNVSLKKHDIFFSQKKIQQNNNFIFMEKNSKLIYKSLLLAKNNDIINTDNYLEHNGSNCYSYQLHKAIVNNKAIINSTGLLKINPYAIKTDGQINYSGLLLSRLSEINIKPKLDIYNNDVKCKHGVSTGVINEDQIFFLKTRGINYKSAYNILLIAFMNDILKDFYNKKSVNKIFEHISCYLSIENFLNEF
ncbi:SufD family Fe-S cluster assembly protein [Enterobacteriaceae endosymbiont of Donacia tomentosa]|uniref:SufD family Fe-S cluster assembly protein n=1 Tax=Enterobacteriaceae endosymbiont of Donacia tomentosa TaxID=2675787 RepID=UPI001456316B|nr:SufD family Fe-S cluster assembly protein [Enterobacteriaceae endosymbiont of Donacia tomentosa]